jgi:VanZ family protein
MTSKVIKSWLPVIIWAAIIFLFSANPDPYTLLPEVWRTLTPLPRVTSFSLTELIGQTMHFIEYAILAFLLSRALFHHQTTTRKNLLIIILLTMLYALSDEIHQLFVPSRTFQLFDLFIDLLGAITGSLIYKKYLTK